MTDTTDEKLKQRLKDLYDDSREYSLGQISEASGMALDRIKELEAKLADAERVARYETDIAQQALDQMRASEAALPAVDPRIMEFLQHVADGSAKDYTNNHKWAKELISAIRALPTPTADELMARIQTGEKDE